MKWSFFYPSITVLFLACSASSFSKSTSHKLPEHILNSKGNWFVTLGAGIQYPDWNNPMKVNNGSSSPRPSNNDLYSTKNQSEPVIALTLGRRWKQDQYWLPSYSLGIFWQYFFRTHLGKTINLNSNPAFTNYKYNWDLTANVLLAAVKLNLFQYGKFSPFINGGIGSSFNRTSNYKESALSGVTPRMSPKFANFSTSEFAYNIGIGVDLQLTPQFIISAGYNYLNLGQISSGSGKATWSNQSLNPGSYHSNELLASVSYFFDK